MGRPPLLEAATLIHVSAQRLAERIQTTLEGDIGHRIDAERLLADAVYARDVLLVCDACLGSDLPALAALLRESLAQPGAPEAAVSPGDAWARPSGFGPHTGPSSGPMGLGGGAMVRNAADRRRSRPMPWRKGA